MSDAELATVEHFLVAYEREGSDADREWRWMSIAPEVCFALLERGFAPESLLLNKKLPVNVLQALAAHPDPHIRSLVATKRGAGPVLQTLASDPDVGVPTLPPREPFQTVVATHTWIDLDGQRLAVFRDGVRPTARLEIAADLEMALGQTTISGFILRDPARYLANGWTEAESTRPDVALGTVLATYIHLLDGQFVDRLGDGDAAARRAVEELLERAKEVNASPQRSVLLEALDGIIDTFFS